MFKKLRDFNESYSNLFFLIALLFIIIFLIYIAFTNRTKVNECVIPEKIVNNYSNYSYNIKYSNDDKNIAVYVKRYDSKYIFEVNENDIKNVYYLEYTDMLKKGTDDLYHKYNIKDIIEGIDNKFLILDYINDISLESTVTTINERSCYINRKNNLTMCISLDKSIELEKDDYKLVYTITDIGNVEDFNVNISSSFLEDEIIEE